MKNAFVTRRRVEFMDTDMAGIVHFATFFRYMETAEHELLRKLGVPVVARPEERPIGWPRVSCGFEYLSPLRFPGEIEVHLGVASLRAKSITYEARIMQGGKVLAKGHSTCACCEIGSAHQLKAIAVPGDIVEKLRPYLIPTDSESEDA